MTHYPEVNTILKHLLESAKPVLGRHFIGMYLYGSLSSGGFNPQSSDIDFLFVVDEPLPEDVIAGLKEMHTRIGQSGLKWAKKLEGSYINQKALRKYDPENDKHPTIGVDWDFNIGEHGKTWTIQRHIVREWGQAIEGPDPKILIDPVSRQDLEHAVLNDLRMWWLPKLDDPSFVNDIEYQAFAILTMCRIRYTMVQGTIVSKPVAAKWMQNGVSNRWVPLIAQALLWPQGDGEDMLEETLALIRETCEVCLS